MKKKLFSILALLLVIVTGAMAQTTYPVTVKSGTEDAEKWTATPNPAAAGQTVTVTYTGSKKVKSVKAKPNVNYVDLSTLTGDYIAQNGDVLMGTLSGVTQRYKISIAAGATVTLANASINGIDDGEESSALSSVAWAGLTCLGNATIILKDGTTNTVTGFYKTFPGIFVPTENTLIIKGETAGTGSLNASSNGKAAGVGAGFQVYCGNIDIQGGVITATGGESAAGIGGAYNCSCGNINISGGTITATSGKLAAGIGGGQYGNCGNITITDGVTRVEATKGTDAYYSIGAGIGGSCGTVTIGGTVSVGTTEDTYIYEPSH